MNVLLLSAGRRTQIIKYFKNTFSEVGCVIAADCDADAPALYAADRNYIVPKITSCDYLPEIKRICAKEQIKILLSLIDPELLLLAEKKRYFQEIMGDDGIVVVSDVDSIKLSFDKFKAYDFCVKANILTPITFESLDTFISAHEAGRIQFPVIVKPRNGSASSGVCRVENLAILKEFFKGIPNLIIQEYLNGSEYGVDVYVDLISREVISVFIKKKIKMRAGETDKAESVHDEKIFALVSELVRRFDLIGPLDVDVMKVGNDYYFLEVNPRFGGGYPLAYECGVNFPKMLRNNACGVKNSPSLFMSYPSGVRMLKYDKLHILR